MSGVCAAYEVLTAHVPAADVSAAASPSDTASSTRAATLFPDGAMSRVLLHAVHAALPRCMHKVRSSMILAQLRFPTSHAVAVDASHHSPWTERHTDGTL